MIPKPEIAQWKAHAPWNEFGQIEQDLIISRALVAIFSGDFLHEHLAFRGWTALHKLYLNPAPRYSEDLDIDSIVKCFHKYMEFSVGKAPPQKEFLLNIEVKEKDPSFIGDMEALLRPPLIYDQGAAFEWLKNEVIPKM